MKTQDYLEKLKIYSSCGINEESQVCENCAYYYHHYVKVDPYNGGYSRLTHGHCSYKRVKSRCATDTCDYFKACKEI